MILKSLRLKNFKGLLAGVGLAEVFIDFDRLPDGLIAVVGANGSGKTTVLDNSHPFRLQPYKLRKAAGWSPAAFSFYDQCEGEALKELVFEMGGKVYKALVLIDAPRRKQEAYLYQQNGGQWVPVNDGKTKTFDEAVEQVCGSPALFFTSVFRSQGAKNLSDYTRGDIMGIVAELLNIDHIRDQGKKAKDVADALLLERDGLSVKAVDLLRGLEGHCFAVDRKATLEQEVLAAKERRSGLEAQATSLEQALRTAEAAVAAQDAERRRLADKRQALSGAQHRLDEARMDGNRKANDLGMEMSRVRTALAQTLSRLESERTTVRTALAEDERRLAAALADIDTKVARYEKIQSGGEQIRLKVAEEQVLAGKSAELREAVGDARLRLAAAQERTQQARSLRSKIDSANRHLKQLLQQASGLGALDCKADGSGWVNESCPLLTGAVKAKHDAAAAQVEVAELESEGLFLRFSPKEEDGSAVDEMVLLLKTIEMEIRQNEAALVEAQKFTRLLPELEQAEAQLLELAALKDRSLLDLSAMEERAQVRLKGITDLCASENAAADGVLVELQERMDIVRTEGDAKLSALGQEVKSLESEIAALELSLLFDPAQDVAKVRTSMDELRRAQRSVEDLIADLAGKMGAVETQLQGFAELRKQLDDIEGVLGAFDANIADWRLLQKGCSNDGIIALEIDDAGPAISSIANDLLRTCYGPRFSVRFETQATKVDGGMKEVFDILVYDSETDEVVSITEKSGGQCCWLEDALTRAICLFNIHRSDRVFGTIFSDEKDGALDEGKKIEFMAVKRRSLELGSHARELFITQTAELIGLAGGAIRLSPGKVEVG